MSRLPRICLLLALVVTTARWLPAQQDASPDEVFKRLRQRHEARISLEVTSYTRELRISVQDQTENPAYRLDDASYTKLTITRRAPDALRLIQQTERQAEDGSLSGRTLVFGRIGSAQAQVLLLGPAAKQPSRITIPPELFLPEIKQRLGFAGNRDPLIPLLIPESAAPILRSIMLFNAFVTGTEEINGVRLTRIEGSHMTNKLTIWVDAQEGTLIRMLETPDPRHIHMGWLNITETRYHYDFSKGVADADFDLDAGWASARSGLASEAGFPPWREFVDRLNLTQSRPEFPALPTPPTPPASPAKPPVSEETFSRQNTPAEPPKPSPSTPAEPAPTVETQQLTAAQMEAVVLIEGDEGVGTGFIARIRDVLFVVTNIHVIGGNESIRVKTVRGVSIPVAGIFGAQGRDIAILRVQGDYAGPALTLAEDPLKTARLGDKIVVVGNRRGGGVATQISGVIQGIGPDRLEVDARFQPGNSGSPIIHLASGEVLGVATYSQTRKLDELDGPTAKPNEKKETPAAEEEQRWFGFRSDSISKWEAIDLVRWRAQARRISDFQEDSEAIYHAMYGHLETARRNPRVRIPIDRFEDRANRLGGTQVAMAQEVKEFFHSLRALAETGVKDLKTGDYYDFFRTSEYWESSIPQQLKARTDIMERLEKATDNSAAFISRLRR